MPEPAGPVNLGHEDLGLGCRPQDGSGVEAVGHGRLGQRLGGDLGKAVLCTTPFPPPRADGAAQVLDVRPDRRTLHEPPLQSGTARLPRRHCRIDLWQAAAVAFVPGRAPAHPAASPVNPDTLAGAIEATCTRFADRPALVSSDRSITYGELWHASGCLAAAWRRLGVGPGDRVVCQLPNCPEHLMTALATWRCGAIHVGTDMDLAPPELAWRVERTDAALVVASTKPRRADAGLGGPDALTRLRAADPGVPVVVAGPDPGGDGCTAISDLLEQPNPGEGREPGPAPEDRALIFFTSGTTGAPKGVVRHHGELLRGWSASGRRLEVRPEDVHLAQLPMAHGFGFGMAVVALLTGGKLVLQERFSAEQTLQLISKERVTVLHGTPVHFTLLTEALEPARHEVSSLRIGRASAARFSRGVLERVFERLGMDLELLYGCSEGLGWATRDRQDMLAGSVGRPPPDVVRVVNHHRQSLLAGELGEIACRKFRPVDYWGEPEAGADDPDWYFTGDLGRVDADGRLFVLARIKQQVNRGGLRVSPGEVEEALSRHPGLDDVAVIGIASPVMGEILCACVVPLEASPTLPELRAFLRPHLADHKLPERLTVLPAIPRTSRGKVDHQALLTQVLQLGCHEGSAERRRST